MDSTVYGAIIGAIATISAVIIAWWLQQKKPKAIAGRRKLIFKPDADDIYFMTYLLHDGYEQGTPLSTHSLAEHHSKYAPLELEAKLIRLASFGFIVRCNKKTAGMSTWQILPYGVDFMLSNGHQLQDILDEQRANA